MRQKVKKNKFIKMTIVSVTSLLQSLSPKLLRKEINCGQNKQLPPWCDLRHLKKKYHKQKSLSAMVYHRVFTSASNNNNYCD